MRTDELIMLVLKYSDKNMIAGRTLFQKTLYFIQEKLALDLDFAPHYYGPYSTQVTDEIADLCAVGFISENIEALAPFSFGSSYEPRKYSYHLTEKGDEVSQLVERKNISDAKDIEGFLVKMKDIGAIDDYKSLSVAAKMHHILKNKGPVKVEEVLNEAKALDWNIDQAEAEKAIDFLLKMGLDEVRKIKSS